LRNVQSSTDGPSTKQIICEVAFAEVTSRRKALQNVTTKNVPLPVLHLIAGVIQFEIRIEAGYRGQQQKHYTVAMEKVVKVCVPNLTRIER